MKLPSSKLAEMSRIWVLLFASAIACRPSSSDPTGATQPEATTENSAATESSSTTVAADVLDVDASGSSDAYNLSVTLESPDTGCDQYANWWEVLDEDGQLLYRRILGHSHVDEQPFTRGGGPVPIESDTTVIVRAHMNTGGYEGTVLSGSVDEGFTVRADLPEGFAAQVETLAPQPTGCAF